VVMLWRLVKARPFEELAHDAERLLCSDQPLYSTTTLHGSHDSKAVKSLKPLRFRTLPEAHRFGLL
jgi:hypothetical protein